MSEDKKYTLNGSDEKSIRVLMLLYLTFSMIMFLSSIFCRNGNIWNTLISAITKIDVWVYIIMWLLMLVISSRGDVKPKIVTIVGSIMIVSSLYSIVLSVINLFEVIQLHKKDLADSSYQMYWYEGYYDDFRINIITSIIWIVVLILIFTVKKRRVLLGILSVYVAVNIVGNILEIFNRNGRDMTWYIYILNNTYGYGFYLLSSHLYIISVRLFYLWVIVKKYRMIEPVKKIKKKQPTISCMNSEVGELNTCQSKEEVFKFCSNCGAKTKQEAKFCNRCGSKFIL